MRLCTYRGGVSTEVAISKQPGTFDQNTHSRQDFVDINITGTLNLLEEAVTAGVESFVFTSTTSVFGEALPYNR